MEIYLDDGHNITLSINTQRERAIIDNISLRKYFIELNPKLEENIIWNLYNFVSLKQHYNDTNKYDVYVGKQLFFVINIETKEVQKKHSLTAFEVRRLAQSKYSDLFVGDEEHRRPIFFPRDEHMEFKIKTDLHSHLSAVLNGETLIELGKENNISYPLRLAHEIGLDVFGLLPDEYGNFKLNDILDKNEKNFNILRDSLDICPYTNETFVRMEEIYKTREPFTKNKDILEPILWKIAEKYVECGVEYVELSSTEVIRDVEFLSKMHEILPKIEEFWKTKGKTINIRFLAAIARDAIEEKKDDEIDILKTIIKSPYIAGCDFLGHESNPTTAIEKQLREMVEFFSLNCPNKTIRVHAGETDIFNNVEEALNIINESYSEISENNSQAKLPPIRIGHAVYKVKSPIVKSLVKKLGVTFECITTSNYGLNNISDYNSVVKKNLDSGIPTVLGTDGFGLYGTTPINEVVLAKGRGVEDFSLIEETENKIIERSLKDFEETKLKFSREIEEQLNNYHRGNISALFIPKYRYDKPQYIGNNKMHIDAQNKEFREKLNEFLKFSFELSGTKIRTKENWGEFEESIEGKIPIAIINESLKTDDGIEKEFPVEVKNNIDYLIKNLDPKKAFFVIAGIKCGSEKYLLSQLQKNKRKKFQVFDFVTEQAIMRIDDIVPNSVITDAIMLQSRTANILGSNFFVSKALAEFLKQHNGILIADGGAAVVADIIQYSYNIGDIDIYLNSQAKGTARNKTRQFDDTTSNGKLQKNGKICIYSSSNEFKKLFEGYNPALFIERMELI